MEQQAIRAAWERFLADGTGPADLARPVAASWERSRSRGISAALTEAPLAEEPEIFRRRSMNAALLNTARPALERSRLFLAEASSMMILSDAAGFIIETYRLRNDDRNIETPTAVSRCGAIGESRVRNGSQLRLREALKNRCWLARVTSLILDEQILAAPGHRRRADVKICNHGDDQNSSRKAR